MCLPSASLSLNLDLSWQRILPFIALFLVLGILGRYLKSVLFLSVLLMLSAIVASRAQYSRDQLQVLDVGQGLSILLQYQGHHWVYDLGKSYERGSAFESVLMPIKRAQFHASPASGLIVSHGDDDHAGAYELAIEKLEPKEIWSGEVDRLAHPDLNSCLRGMHWQLEGLHLEVLYPSGNTQALPSNDRSCVLSVEVNGARFLLMGDLEAETEKALVRQYGKALKADVLIAGHHGSRNASSYALLKVVRPDVVVFSSGYRNRFGHPHREAVERVERFGARIYRTDRDGAIVFDLSQSELQVTSMRSEKAAFWLSAW